MPVQKRKTKKSIKEPKEKAKIYHPPVDMTREQMMRDLAGADIVEHNDNKQININDNKKDNEEKMVKDNEEKMVKDNEEKMVKDKILEEGNYSYSYIANLKRKGEITQDQALDLKAKKQGFKNHLERVTMRYLEAVKDIKYKQLNNLFKNDNEKNKLFKKMKSMEVYLKEKEKEKEKEIKK